MKLLDIVKNVISGDIKIDYFEHRLYDSIVKILIEKEQFLKQPYSTFLSLIIDRDLQIGDIIDFGFDFGNDDFRCQYCDELLKLYIIDEHTLGLTSVEQIYKNKCLGSINYTVDKCVSYPLIQTGYLKSEIDVLSGKLLFKNYFHQKEIFEINDGKYHSIQSITQRNELMQYLAERNVGYGQMGNMSVTIFKNADGTEIIIGEEYAYTKNGREKQIKHKGFTKIGTISLQVWRWMCSDLENLKKYNEDIPEKLKSEKNNVKYGYDDYVCLDVKPGCWVIEHYFDFVEDTIYSKLYLKC